MQRPDIAIIGGGLVGASLALALQAGAKARGWRILLVEPFAPGDTYQPSYDARSSALSYGSRLIYQRLGVWDALTEHAEAIREIQVSDQGRFGVTQLLARDENLPALGYVVENAWIGQVLWQALDREVVEWRCPAEVRTLTAVADGYRLELEDGDILECGLAVLADGGRSALRESLGIEVRRTVYEQTALIANVSTNLGHGGRAFERFTPHGPLALLPLPGQRSALVWTQPDGEALRLQQAPAAVFLAELQQAVGYRLGSFTQVGTRHAYPLTLLEANEQVRPHLVVLGNAAHSLHPIAGQGFNLSLRDVDSLAECLLESAAAPGDFATLQDYLQRQRLDQQLTIGFSDRITRLFSNSRPWLSAGRNLGLVGLELCPPAKSAFARQAMGLGTRP